MPTASAGAVDAGAPMDAKSAPTGAWKTARARFPTAPTAIIFIKIRRREIRCWTRAHRRVSRIDQFFTTVDYQRTLPRTKLLRQLRKHRARSAFRGEQERRERLLTELRKARLTGIRVTLPAETLDAKLASLPEGVSVSRDRIEVRFNGAKEAVERLYALAYALVNDYERFEELVDGGVGGGGEVSE